MGVAGNEEVDRLAKQAIKFQEVDIKIALIKSIIAKEVRKKWQKEWDSGNKGRHLYNIQGTGLERRNIGNRRKDVIISGNAHWPLSTKSKYGQDWETPDWVL